MSRNIEIKARIESVDTLASRVAAVADRGPIAIEQDDTFFACAQGRLKLRKLAADAGELIFYRRADQPGPKESFYWRSETREPDGLLELLNASHEVLGRVRKRRILFMVGRTRVHLDRVDDLGDFLELEVVLAELETANAGREEAHALMARLGVPPETLVAEAYVDLIARRDLRRDA